jgi:peptidoglycan/xylan/chitin deacetylase (PgdA/CDA1 family)
MLRILTYHRIAETSRDPHLNPRLISASPEDFASQIHFLALHYRVVSLEEVLVAFETGRSLPRRAVLITFDDAYRDFLEVAWPVLQAHRLPSTMFVATAYPDRPERSFWWDRLHRCCTDPTRDEVVLPKEGLLPLRTREERLAALQAAVALIKSLPHDHAMALVEEICDQLGEDETEYPSVLGWDELRALSQENVSFCPHTQWHPLLTRVAPGRARTEIAGSLEDMRRELDDVLPVFAYPDGAHDDAAVEIVRDAGLQLALTQIDGHNDPRKSDPLRLCRTNITRRTSLPILRLRLQTWFTRIDRWRHRRRGDSHDQAALAQRQRNS